MAIVVLIATSYVSPHSIRRGKNGEAITKIYGSRWLAILQMLLQFLVLYHPVARVLNSICTFPHDDYWSGLARHGCFVGDLRVKPSKKISLLTLISDSAKLHNLVPWEAHRSGPIPVDTRRTFPDLHETRIIETAFHIPSIPTRAFHKPSRRSLEAGVSRQHYRVLGRTCCEIFCLSP